jgi:hypothetical protein
VAIIFSLVTLGLLTLLLVLYTFAFNGLVAQA